MRSSAQFILESSRVITLGGVMMLTDVVDGEGKSFKVLRVGRSSNDDSFCRDKSSIREQTWLLLGWYLQDVWE